MGSAAGTTPVSAGSRPAVRCPRRCGTSCDMTLLPRFRVTPPRCGTDLKVASHSVGAGFPPNRARSRAQPFSAPVCHALRTSVESAPNLKTDPLRRSSDAGICNPDMESPARQNNGEKFRSEPSIHSTPRVIQRPASNRQQPRLTRTGDGPTRAGDCGTLRETQRYASIHSSPG